jgi:hypothetical protein
MSKTSKKNINWVIDEFTTIDLIPKILPSSVKGSQTEIFVEENNQKHSYRSSVTENDELGRPVNLKNFDRDGKLTEEYRYYYQDNIQKIELYELGKKSCIWENEYNEKDLLIRSVYSELPDNSKDVDSYEYDKDGRLLSISMETHNVEEEEPVVGYELEWENDQLISISEIYGEEEEASFEFEYNEKNQVKSVKKYANLVDEDDEDVEELIEEQKPVYDAQGRLVENSLIYHENSAKLVISYEFEGDSVVATKTSHKEFEGTKLVRKIEFIEDLSGNLLKSTEEIYNQKIKKTEIFSYH